MTLQSRLVDLLVQAYQEELAFVADLSDADLSASGREDAWAPKDTLAHVAEWKTRSRQNLGLMLRGEQPPIVEDIDLTNAGIFNQHRHLQWSDVREMMEEAHEGLVQLTRSLNDRLLTSNPLGETADGRPIWRHIVGSGHVHSLLHVVQMRLDRGEVEAALALMEASSNDLSTLEDSPGWHGTLTYNLACMHAVAGDADRAVEMLAQALKLEPGLKEWSRQDPDLASVRELPEYEAICST